jgi:hypothetical protein
LHAGSAIALHRDKLASSGPGMVEPKITSSNSVASNGMRNSSERAA